MEPPRSILVLKPSSFGDIIHTLPAVARLRGRWPDSRISWLANTEWCPLLEGSPVVDRVIPFPRRVFRGWRGLLGLPRWMKATLGSGQYDLVLDYQGLLRTALLGRYAGGSRFLGLADAREGATWFYDQTVAVPNGIPHAVERYLALSRAAIEGVATVEPANDDSGSVRFPLPEGDPIEQPGDLRADFVLLHPFARGKDKSFTTEQVRSLCAGIQNRQVVLVGGAAEAIPDLPPHCLDLLNRTTLRQLIWLVRRAGFVVSVDSGPAHLAAALGKPMVAIHTWSDPRRVGPYLPSAQVLKNGEMLRFEQLRTLDESFFSMPAKPITASQIEMICRAVTSS